MTLRARGMWGLVVLAIVVGAVGVAMLKAERTGDVLLDRRFVVVSMTEGGQAREPVAGTVLSLYIADDSGRDFIGWGADYDRPGAPAACNGATSSVKVTGSRLLIRDGVSHTDEGCETGLLLQDDWLTDFFTSDPMWELSGDQLSLTSGDTEMELVETRDIGS